MVTDSSDKGGSDGGGGGGGEASFLTRARAKCCSIFRPPGSSVETGASHITMLVLRLPTTNSLMSMAVIYFFDDTDLFLIHVFCVCVCVCCMRWFCRAELPPRGIRMRLNR